MIDNSIKIYYHRRGVDCVAFQAEVKSNNCNGPMIVYKHVYVSKLMIVIILLYIILIVHVFILML